MTMKSALKKFSKILMPLPFIAMLASCSDGKRVVDLKLKYVTANSAPSAVTDGEAQAQVAEAATAVGHSLQQLSAMELATHPGKKIPKPFTAKGTGMGQIASVDWTGPAEPLLRKIAKATHYHLRIVGHKPAIPVLVSVNMRNQPVAAILRNVTYQIVTKANIAVYPRNRSIELRYNGN